MGAATFVCSSLPCEVWKIRWVYSLVLLCYMVLVVVCVVRVCLLRRSLIVLVMCHVLFSPGLKMCLMHVLSAFLPVSLVVLVSLKPELYFWLILLRKFRTKRAVTLQTTPAGVTLNIRRLRTRLKCLWLLGKVVPTFLSWHRCPTTLATQRLDPTHRLVKARSGLLK